MSFRREAEAAAIAAAAEKQRVSASYIALIPCLMIILFELTLHDWPFFLTGWICSKCGLTECSIQLQRPYTKSGKFGKAQCNIAVRQDHISSVDKKDLCHFSARTILAPSMTLCCNSGDILLLLLGHLLEAVVSTNHCLQSIETYTFLR